MGAEKRMADRSGVMRVYAAQTAPVIAELERTGRCFCREEYIRKKYGECADGFLIAYRYLAEKGAARVPRPAGAELPYWVSPDGAGLPRSETFLALDVRKQSCCSFRVRGGRAFCSCGTSAKRRRRMRRLSASSKRAA